MGVDEHHLVDDYAEDQYIAERTREFDRNKDGVGLRAAKEEHQIEVSIISDLFHDMDSDSDGQLNLEELPALVDTLTSWQNINE